MAGEIIKGTVNLGSVNGSTVNVVSDADGQKNINEVAAYDFETDTPTVLSMQSGNTTIDVNTPKLAVEQGKQFFLRQVTWDDNVGTAAVENAVNDRINEWVSTNGYRYDDLHITVNNSGGGTHDILIVIVRYY